MSENVSAWSLDSEKATASPVIAVSDTVEIKNFFSLGGGTVTPTRALLDIAEAQAELDRLNSTAETPIPLVTAEESHHVQTVATIAERVEGVKDVEWDDAAETFVISRSSQEVDPTDTLLAVAAALRGEMGVHANQVPLHVV